MRANNALLRRQLVAREVHEGSPPPPEKLHPIRLCCKAFRGGAGDGNRTRTFSLGTARTAWVCAWYRPSFAVTSGLEGPKDAGRNGTPMAR